VPAHRIEIDRAVNNLPAIQIDVFLLPFLQCAIQAIQCPRQRAALMHLIAAANPAASLMYLASTSLTFVNGRDAWLFGRCYLPAAIVSRWDMLKNIQVTDFYSEMSNER
jgi:hypothetical protein